MSSRSEEGLAAGGGGRVYADTMSRQDRLRRMVWELVYFLLFRPTPRFMLEGWRQFLLRSFGAKIGKGCRIAPSCIIWAPWNLTLGDQVCLAAGVDCYTMAEIAIGDFSTVSQRAFLCAGSHDISRLSRPLVVKPITIGRHAWICAEAFVGPGVTIGEGSVVAARAVTVQDVPEWTVVAGNPARPVKKRQIRAD